MDTFLHGARTHVPIPSIWDSDELLHQECLVRIALARRLYACRTNSPEAEALYRQIVCLHARWLAVQQQQQQPAAAAAAAASSRELELEQQLQLDLGGEGEQGEEGEEGEEDEDNETASLSLSSSPSSSPEYDQGWPGTNLLLSEVGSPFPLLE